MCRLARWTLNALTRLGSKFIGPQALTPGRCTNAVRQWLTAFPGRKAEVRKFLTMCADAFAISRAPMSAFAPGDQIMDVYRSIYPPGRFRLSGDAMELETLTKYVREDYGLEQRALGSSAISMT